MCLGHSFIQIPVWTVFYKQNYAHGRRKIPVKVKFLISHRITDYRHANSSDLSSALSH